jgi:benzoate-CoA ligase
LRLAAWSTILGVTEAFDSSSSPPFNIAREFISRPAREHPQKIAIRGVAREATYAQVEMDANRVAQALRDYGCKAGDRVAIALFDSLEFVACFFGAAMIGAIAVPVNPAAHVRDYQHYLSDSGARFAIVHESVQTIIGGALPVSSVEYLIVVAEYQGSPIATSAAAGAKSISWHDWLPKFADEVAIAPTTSSDPAFFLYTSGTGGNPRAAVHRHGDMLVAVRSYCQGVIGLRPDDVTFSVSKLFFAYGLGNGVYFPFSAGASTILFPGRPRPETISEVVAKHRPTVFFAVPTFYAGLVRAAENGVAMDFSSVRLAISAGEPLPREILDRFRSRFGIEILDGIGSTEMLHIYISSRPGEVRPGSCGKPVPGYDVKILDENDEAVPAGETGNLWVRGGSAFSGYWNDREITSTVFFGDWFLTGDKFSRDGDGFYFFQGRANDMMKIAGMWVSPGDVENALLAHPAVAECAVVARLDESGLSKMIAFIVLQKEGTLPPEKFETEIRNFLRSRLESFQCPREFRIVASLPRTPTGKVRRYLL